VWRRPDDAAGAAAVRGPAMSARYTIGIDFGTASARALLVDVASGREVATSVSEYRHGVIDDRLPIDHEIVRLPPDWALQDPSDYVRAIQETVPAVVAGSGIDPASVVGIGIAFTSCTMLPTTADGTPLCEVGAFRAEPHAWIKLWKHHAAQPEADRINETAERRGEAWLPRYGGRISSEWFFSKALQILDEAPAVYAAADRLIEGADWIVWQLTGVESRNSCTAGYKALWSKRAGFPDASFFAALDPRLASIVDDKLSRTILPPGSPAGGLSEIAAGWTGLPAGIPVAVGNVDAHASVPAATVTGAGRMVAVMGTSTCHLVLAPDERFVEGMCGVVEDGVIPGWFAYEAGQSAVGDIFGWFTERAVPPAYHALARERGQTVHEILAAQAALLLPGESGLLALDWWNGNRSILVDVDLTGLLVGATLATDAPAMYRALIEATAFGTRAIVDALVAAGVAVDEIVACGGLPGRNPFLMQVYADITGLPISVAGSAQTPALGAAMFAAVAAGTDRGGYGSIVEAAARMARLADETYRPTAAHRPVYDILYREYIGLQDLFGRAPDGVMKTLKRLRVDAMAQGAEARISEARISQPSAAR
jgi:L-ribulokinase